MSFAKELCLFSEVKGVVLSHGRAAPNAEVERVYNWGWKDVTKSEKVKTDECGTPEAMMVRTSRLSSPNGERPQPMARRRTARTGWT